MKLLFRSLFCRQDHPRTIRRSPKRLKPRRRPTLEPLEDRVVPSATASLSSAGALGVSVDLSLIDNNTNTILLRRTAPGSGRIEVLDNGLRLNVSSPTGTLTSVPLSAISRINVFGNSGDDTLVVDSTNGFITLPVDILNPGDINFNGGRGDNSLTLQGGHAIDTTHIFRLEDVHVGPEVDSVVIASGARQVVHSILQRELLHLDTGVGILDLIDADQINIDVTDTDVDVIRLDNGASASDGRLRVSSRAIFNTAFPYPAVEFANKASLSLIFLGGSTITLAATESVPGLAREVFRGIHVRATIFNVESIPAGTRVAIEGTPGNDVINVTISQVFEFNPVTRNFQLVNNIRSALSVDGGPGGNTLNVVYGDFTPILSQPVSAELSANRLDASGLAAEGIVFGNVKFNLTMTGAADSVAIRSTAEGVTTNVNTGGGADTVVLGGATVNGIRGPVNIDGGPNATGTTDVVILSEVEPPGFINFGTIGTLYNDHPPGRGFLTGFGMGATVNFHNTELVAIIEGPSNDFISFSFPSPPSFGITLSLDGGTDGVTFHGTDRSDHIRISRRVGPDGPEVIADINGQTLVAGYQGGETVRVLAGDGNDQIIMDESTSVTWKAELYGEAGNDRLFGAQRDDLVDGGPGNDYLQGGGGHDILLGGEGNDRLAGQDGHDLLIGGTGVDHLDGEDGDDILIGGTTAFDTDQDALAAILAEWTSPRSYETRVANLRGESNPQFNQRLNQDFFLKATGPSATVFDDGAEDVLKGGPGLDWFFAKLDGRMLDVILDRNIMELVEELS